MPGMITVSSPTLSPAPSSADSLPVEHGSETTAFSGTEQGQEVATAISKKKKKKKSKRAVTKPAAILDTPVSSSEVSAVPPCLLSRNKHMRYISSYQARSSHFTS